MLFNKTKLAIIVSFLLSTTAYSSNKTDLPDRFPSKIDTPDIQKIINNSSFNNGWNLLQDHWGKGFNSELKNNQFLNTKELKRTWDAPRSQMVTLEGNSHIINSVIDSIQVDIGSSFLDSDNSSAIGVTVKGGLQGAKGFLKLERGTKAFDTVIENMGAMEVRRNAEAYNTYIGKGGSQTLGYNGYAQANFIDGGEQILSVASDGAIAEDSILMNGGQQIIYKGTAKNTHIGAGSYQLTSGEAIDTTIYDGGYQLVFRWDETGAKNTVIHSGGTQRVQVGNAHNSSVYGTQIISSQQGDWVNGAWVEEDGDMNAFVTATDSTVYSGGVQQVEKYGIARNTVVDGGRQVIDSYGQAEGALIKNGGETTIHYGGYAAGGVITVDDGALIMEGGNGEHAWEEALDVKGAYASDVLLNSEKANLYVQHSRDTEISTITIGNLHMMNSNLIFGTAVDRKENKYSRAEITDLKGKGLIAFNTDIDGQKGDFLLVENTIAKDDKFHVAVNDSGHRVSDKELHIISTGGGSLADSFTLNEKQVYADAGAYQVKYELEHRNNGEAAQEEWYLTAKETDITTPTTDAVLAMANVTPSIWDAELYTLRQRLGELDNKTHDNGLWGRYISSRYKVDKEAGAAYKQDMNGFVIGGDHAFMQESGVLYLGAMIGYSRSDIDLRRGGKGNVDSYTLASYATYFADSGFYIDGVLKYNYFKNETDALTTQRNTVSGKYNLSGGGFSFELGKKYEQDALFTAPYFLASGFYSGKKEYTLSNGTQANVDNAASFKTELGSVLGYNLKLQDGNIKPYVRLALNYEFIDNNKITINSDDSFKNDMSGIAVKTGIGTTAIINNDFSLYAEVNYMKGKDISMPYSANLGMRYFF